MAEAGHGAFHPLRVAAVEPLTDDAVAVTLAVPPPLREAFRHRPGQHVAVRRRVGGAETRRTYSICTPAADPRDPDELRTLRIGIRRVEGGDFSTYALKELAAGDTLEVMAPVGRFVLDPQPGHFAAIVGGSGITPVLSIVTTLLEQQPDARFCLIRGDRTAASTMFLEEVADLKDRWPERFQLVSVLSQERQDTGLESGRLDTDRLRELLPALVPVRSVDGWFLCGPYGLVAGAERALRSLRVPRARIHQEIFHVDSGGTGTVESTRAVGPTGGTVSATLDGRAGTWSVGDGESLLEAVLRNRSDAPYACKGGVCGTCRAFLVSGEVVMDRNFALEPDEVSAGYVLACQSHLVGEKAELDFDR